MKFRRDRSGHDQALTELCLVRNRPWQGTYQQFAQLDLLPSVSAILKRYERWAL